MNSTFARCLVGFLSVAAFAAAPAQKVVSEPVVEASAKHSFLDPVGAFVQDSILRPKVPFELVPGKDPNAWGLVIEPYLWLTALDGTTIVNSGAPTHVSASAKKLLQNFKWGIMSQGEIRKGRWGVLVDGYYASLGGTGNLNGNFYSSATLNAQQAFVSMALAYRVIDDRRGYFDVYAGARYNYLGLQASYEKNTQGITNLADELTDQLQAGINARVKKILASSGIEEDIQESHLAKILGSHNGPLAAYIKAEAALQVAIHKGEDTAALESRVATTKKKLSKELAAKIEDALPGYDSGDEWWIDPIVGARAQINLTRWLFLAAQGDVGGFGVGSQITWNAQATVGINFTRNLFGELGYRYMYVDYTNGGFLYQMNSYGLFGSLGVKF